MIPKMKINIVGKVLRLLIILIIAPFVSGAQEDNVYSLKSALIYNFAKFAQWPENSVSTEIEICYFNDLYKSGLSLVSGKKIADRSIKIRQVDTINELDTCQLIYIDKSKRDILNRLFLKVKGKPILTVSDIAGFHDEGGMIEITVSDNRLRFLINLDPVNQSKIVLSSQMLKLAIAVRR